MHVTPVTPPLAASSPVMSGHRDDALLDRMRAEYAEMPGLCLTRVQACRLWGLPADVCQHALDRLVASGYLTTSGGGGYLRPSAAA